MSDERRTTEPHDDLTQLGADVSDFIHEKFPGDDVKCIVFVTEGNRTGIAICGYQDDSEAMVDLLIHLRAIFKANGKDFHIGAIKGVG